MKWEYLTWVVGFAGPRDQQYESYRGGRVKYINGVGVKDWNKGAAIDAWLKQAGAEGWELVGLGMPMAALHGDNAFYVFKRPLTPELEARA